MKTKSKLSAYILRGSTTALLFSCVIVALCSAINLSEQPPKASPLQDNDPSWVPTGSLVTARSRHTATLLPNGKVLVAAGFNELDGFLSSAELYDPASGTWTATGSLGTARAYHTATLLPNGK